MTTCILCVPLGLVLGTVQDLLCDPETQNDKAASLIAQFKRCKIVASSAECKCIFAALESHLATDRVCLIACIDLHNQRVRSLFYLLVGLAVVFIQT